jgi:hypothetical protein
MEQVSSTKKETSANWSLNSNTPSKEIFVMTQRSTRTMPAYTQRGRQFAALMAGARR